MAFFKVTLIVAAATLTTSFAQNVITPGGTFLLQPGQQVSPFFYFPQQFQQQQQQQQQQLQQPQVQFAFNQQFPQQSQLQRVHPAQFLNSPQFINQAVQQPATEARNVEQVLDFSSGSAQVAQSTATKVNRLTEDELTKGSNKAFSTFLRAIIRADLRETVDSSDDITIFSPMNDAFEKFNQDVETMPIPELRRILLKHIVKGTLPTKNLQNGPLVTLGGETVEIRVKPNAVFTVAHNSGESKITVKNIETKWGLVHVIDSVLT